MGTSFSLFCIYPVTRRPCWILVPKMTISAWLLPVLLNTRWHSHNSVACRIGNRYHPLFVHKYLWHFCRGACHGHGIAVVRGTHGEKMFFKCFWGVVWPIFKQPKKPNTLNCLLYPETAINTKLKRTIVQSSPSHSYFVNCAGNLKHTNNLPVSRTMQATWAMVTSS